MNPESKKVKRILRKYVKIMENLRKLKVVRTEKLVADLGESLACKYLRLTIAVSPNNKGYDCIDGRDRRYEVKTRRPVFGKDDTYAYSFPVPARKKFAFLVCVSLSYDFRLDRMARIPKKDLRNYSNNIVLTNKLVAAHPKWIVEDNVAAN